MSARDDFQSYVTDIEASSYFKKWVYSYPTEAATWKTYRSALLSGRKVTAPTLATAFGQSLVDAGELYVDATPAISSASIDASQNPLLRAVASPSDALVTSYQWEQGDAAGASLVNIGGATAGTYSHGSELSLAVLLDGTVLSPAWLPSALPPSTLGTALYTRMPESSHIGASPGSAGTHVVAAGGSINTALSACSDGHVVYVHGPSVGYADLSNHHFSAGNPVTVMPFPDEQVTWVGPATDTGAPCLFAANSSGIRFRGFTYRGPHASAGMKLSSCIDIEFDAPVIHDNGGSRANGSHGVLLNSLFSNPWTPCRRVQFWNPKIYDWHANPASANANHGMYWASTDHCMAVNPVIWNDINGGGYGLQLGGGSAYYLVANATVDGVTSLSTGTAGSGAVVWGSTTEGSTAQVDNHGRIVNTLFTNNKAWGVAASGSTADPTSNLVDYCMAYGNPSGQYLPTFGSKVLFAVGAHNIAPVDPAYADRAAHDYHLTGGTPASVKTGANPDYASPYDHDGVPRSATPALGAYAP